MRIGEAALAAVLLLSLVSMCVQVGSGQTCQLTIALVLDISGSMRNVVPEWNVTKAVVQLEAARSFVLNASSDWRIGVVEYHDNATVRIAAASDKNAVAASMSGTAKGDTNLAEGISLAADMLTNAGYGRLVMIVVGDGNPNIGVDPRQRAIDAAALAKKNGIYMLTGGLTLSPSAYALMKEMASNAQYALNAVEVNSLRAWFQNIDSRLCGMIEENPPVVSGTTGVLSQQNMLAWIALAVLLTTVSLFEYRHDINQRLGRGTQITSREPSIGFRARLKKLRIPRRGKGTTAVSQAPPVAPEPKAATGALPLRLSAARLCEYCGRELSTSDRFCDKCGRETSRR